jgi:hypothetical protein
VTTQPDTDAPPTHPYDGTCCDQPLAAHAYATVEWVSEQAWNGPVESSQGSSRVQPGNTYWRDTPMAQALRAKAGFPDAPQEGRPTTRWHVEAAVERLNDVVASMRASGEEPNALTDVVDLLQHGLDGKAPGLTAKGYTPPVYGTPVECPTCEGWGAYCDDHKPSAEGRPTTPQTEAGRAYWDTIWQSRSTQEVLDAILAIEREAAAGALPSVERLADALPQVLNFEFFGHPVGHPKWQEIAQLIVAELEGSGPASFHESNRLHAAARLVAAPPEASER